MKRRITILLAALLLMSGLTWAQSDYSTDYTGNIILSTAGGSNASEGGIIISGTTYNGIKAGTSSKTGAVMITVPSGTKYLHMHVAAWNNTTCSLAVTPTGYSDNIALTANSGISNNPPFTFNGDPSTDDYYKVITFANALGEDTDLTFTAVGGKRFVIWGVTSEEDGAGPTVATPIFNPASGTTFGNEGLQVSISCATDGVAIYYTLDGSTPDDESTVYNGAINLTTTTTIKAIAYDDEDNTSNVATATYTFVDPTAPGSENNPYTVAQARAAVDAGAGITGVYATGIVSAIPNAWSTQFNNITFNMVDAEGDEDFLQAFRCVSTANVNASEVAIGDIVIVYGNLTLYNNTTYEFAQGCQLVSLIHSGAFVAAPTFSPAGGTYTETQTVTISCETEGTTIYYTTDGSEPDDESTEYTAPITVSETMTIKAIAYDSEDQASAVATATYTIQVPVPMQTFNKIEGHNPVDGQVYMIVDLHSGKALTSANGSSAAPTAVEVTITDDQITTDNIDLQWTFETVDSGYIIRSVADNTKWLYSTDANNGVRVGTNENNVWTLDITDETNTDYHGFKHNGTSRYLGVYYNQTSQSPQDWRAYGSVNNNIKETQIALFVNGEAPAPTPSFAIENNEEIAYDATSGSFDFTVNNSVEGGTTTVAEDVDWISDAAITGNSVTFTTTVNDNAASRHGVITLTYTYNRATVTKNVTVTQASNPNLIMTIAEVRAQGTGNVATSGIVTSCVGTTAYIQDATAAICVFGSQLTVGDNIRVSGSLSEYHGLLEITNPEVTVISSGNTIAPEVMTIAEAVASSNQGWYIRIENATVTAISNQNVTITQDDASIVVRFASADDIDFAVNDYISFNGNIGCYNGNQIANPTEVTVQQNTDPIINASDITLDYDATFGEIAYTITNPVTGTVLNAATNADWITNIVVGESSITFDVTENEGEEDRTATITLTYEGAQDKEVTVTQGHYVADYATLPFEFDGGRADIATTNGLTQEGLDSDYTSSPKLKFKETDSWVILHFNEEPDMLSYTIKGNGFSGGTFTVQTSNDGESYTDLAVYTELGAVDTVEFSLAADVRYIKWIYTEKVSGNVALGNINVTKPSTAPAVIVTPDAINAPAEGAEGTLALTYENITDFFSFDLYFCDANGGELDVNPNWIYAEIQDDNDTYSLYYLIDANDGEARTAYIKVYTFDDESEEVYAIVTISQAEFALDYAELPFAFDGGKADIETTDGLTQEGLDSDYGSSPKLKFKTTGTWVILHFNEAPGKLTFDIKGNSFSDGTFTVQTSEDGETYTDLETYTNLTATVQSESFNNLGENVRYIKWIYTEKVNGNVALGNINLLLPSSGDTYNLTIEPFENLEIFTFIDDELTEPMEGAGTIQVAEGVQVMLSVSAEEGYVMQSLMVDGVEHVNDIAEDLTYTFEMPDHDVTISATAIADVPFTGTTYSLATSIESGRHYIITNGIDKAMGLQNNNNRAAVAITIENGVAQVSSTDVYEFVINSFGVCDTITESYLYTIYDASAPGYLYAASSGSNYLKTREFNIDANSLWTIAFGEEDNAVITARGDNTRNLMRYNSGSDLFACYGSGQQPVYLYVKDEEEPQYDFYKDIIGHGEDENNWRLIATPTADNADPDAVGMIAEDGAYDLYGYDSQAVGEEWQNYKIEGTEVRENGLEFGKGYLYASQNNVTLHFQGTPNSATEQEIGLQYAGANGWNLVGNPLNTVAWIEGDFFVMNANGDEIVLSERNEVYPLEGIFVKATEEGQSVMFYDYEGSSIEVGPGDDGLMKLSVSGENGSSDVAYIRFGEGQGLEKFQLNPKHTKLYFTQDNTDYAVVRSTNKGEKPVNFKAAENGIYTLSVNVESVEMEYLHLIDNLTGADIDLLSTPSYSFEATMSDNAARFTLVFIAR